MELEPAIMCAFRMTRQRRNVEGRDEFCGGQKHTIEILQDGTQVPKGRSALGTWRRWRANKSVVVRAPPMTQWLNVAPTIRRVAIVVAGFRVDGLTKLMSLSRAGIGDGNFVDNDMEGRYGIHVQIRDHRQAKIPIPGGGR